MVDVGAPVKQGPCAMVIDPHRVRWYAQSALNGFADLDTETATELAKANLADLLSYLDVTEKPALVLRGEGVEAPVGREAVASRR